VTAKSGGGGRIERWRHQLHNSIYRSNDVSADCGTLLLAAKGRRRCSEVLRNGTVINVRTMYQWKQLSKRVLRH